MLNFYADEDYRDPGVFIGLNYSRFSENGRYFYFSFFTLQNGNQFYVLDMDTFDFQLISNTPGILYKTAGHSIQHHDYDYLYTTEAIGEDDVALYAFDIETGETTRLSPQFPDNVEAIISVTFNENANPARPQEYFVYSGDKKQLYQVSTDGQTLELIHDFPSNNFWKVTDGYWYVQRDFDVEPYQQWMSFIPSSNLELTIPVEIDEDYRIEIEPPSWFRIGDYAFTYARSVNNPSDSILYFIHYSPDQDRIARQITPSEDQDAFISTRPKSWDGETVYFVLDNRLYSGQAPFDDLQLLTDEDLIVSSILHSFENGNLLISATEPSMENRTLFILDCGDS